MFRNILAIAIVVLIVGLGVGEQFFLHDTFTELKDKAQSIESLLVNEDYKTALDETNLLLEWWRVRRDILELTSPHNEVKDHIGFLAQLLGNIVSEQYDVAITTTYAIREDADNKLNILAYRLKNVL